MDRIAFTVIGKPQAKGAHTSFVPRRGDGSIVTRSNGAPMVVTKDSNPAQKASQEEVARCALAARVAADVGLWDGPALVERRYYFTRPVGHYGTGRNAGILRDSAPAYPLTTGGDIDKLDRLLFDALTGTVLRDDKQIVGGSEAKLYAEGDEPPRMEITVILIGRDAVGVQVAAEQLALAA